MRFEPDRFDGLPLLIQPDGHDRNAGDLKSWLADPQNQLIDLLTEHGALLFRGFDVAGAAEFQPVCEAGTPGLAAYTGGGSPRSHVQGKVYTSTEYAADQPIPLHCEYTYFREFPRYIWFHCEIPPATGGQTQIGDMRRLLARLDPAVVAEFDRRGVRYIYNLHGGLGFGRGWQQAFGTEDADEVSAWLEQKGAIHHWTDDGTLHVELHAPGLHRHDRSGEMIWTNQAVSWHIGGLVPQMAERMRKIYKTDERMPKHATYGDGTAIPADVVSHILETLRTQEVVFNWRLGDVMLCDNQRIAHGRRPFTGERRVLVALA